jgi:hypothetical protein
MQAFVPAKIALQMSESKPVMTGRFYLWVNENIRAVFNTYEDVLDGLKTTVEILSEPDLADTEAQSKMGQTVKEKKIQKKLGSRQMSPEQMVAEIKRQQKEIEYLRRQREILKKSYEHTGQGTEHRYAMIKELSVKFGIKECCQVLEVSRSGYYQWVKPGRSERAKAEAKLVEQIVEVFEANKERYGSPRVTRELRQQGVRCSENRVARLMRENELVARVPGRTRR